MTTDKPLSTSSPEAVVAAAMVTPQLLSELLARSGPLAIRHITHALTDQIPDFSKLSSSKQRRLIMGAMDAGDRRNSVVFEKIGWGQWTVKPVLPDQDFDLVLRETNISNAKVKDIVSQESQRRRNSKKLATTGTTGTTGTAAATAITPGAAPAPAKHSETTNINSANVSPKAQHAQPAQPSQPAQPRATVYLDENAVDSDDDEDPHADLLLSDHKQHKPTATTFLNPERRRSTVLMAEHSPETSLEFELLAQKVRPIIKGRRRSSVKAHSPVVIKPSAAQTHQDATSVFRHNNNSTSAIAYQTSVSGPGAAVPTGNNTGNGKIDLDTTPNSEPTSRRASRLSSSKESSIRSTLFPNKNYRWIAKNPGLAHSTNSINKQPQDHFKINHYDIATVDNVLNDHHSETDEEDWASIGAASLRRSSAISSSVNLVNNSPSPQSDDSIKHESLHSNDPRITPTKPAEDKSAAYLLMSLKS